jgi:lipopolysaccharide transport system ATP-binding protein
MVMDAIARDCDRAGEEAIAVRVHQVSKSYGLWSSPSARLKYPLLNTVRRALPSWLGAAGIIEQRSRHMYRAFWALRDVTLEIKKGESWGIIGVNGSGKSTLLKMIAGNLRPTTGYIEVDGNVAILDYSSGLHGGFTGRENVYLKASMHGMSRRAIDAKFASIERFADIGDFIDQPVKTYSSGMLARLGFAILAHVDADIIITDEALAVGDAFFVQKCMDFIRSFLKRGTFLFVSHSTNDVISLCEKAIWLEHGQIRAIGSAKEVADRYLSSRSLENSQRYLERSEGQTMAPEAEVAPNTEVSRQDPELRQPLLSQLTHAKPPRVIKDPRLDFINRSPWRNDLQIPEFAIGPEGFGVGGARIEDVTFEDDSGAVLSWVIGGEMVRLKIAVRAERDLKSPIIGFQVRDRLGQSLFADNTFLVTVEKPFVVAAGQRFEAEFRFQMPLLPVGEYALRPAVALGTESDNAMMHCLDTALVFQSITSGARHGLVGVPMHSIRINLAPLDGDGAGVQQGSVPRASRHVA